MLNIQSKCVHLIMYTLGNNFKANVKSFSTLAPSCLQDKICLPYHGMSACVSSRNTSQYVRPTPGVQSTLNPHTVSCSYRDATGFY